MSVPQDTWVNDPVQKELLQTQNLLEYSIRNAATDVVMIRTMMRYLRCMEVLRMNAVGRVMKEGGNVALNHLDWNADEEQIHERAKAAFRNNAEG